jgi:hypothetical protein
MASGQQLADENVRKFTVWMASKADGEFRSMVIRGVLSRTEIATECGFAKSALAQNPRIRSALADLEATLRERGVLPSLASPAEEQPGTLPQRTPDAGRNAMDAERLSRLEKENASLKAENAELKRLLTRYTVLQEALAETGRLPR